MTYNTNSENVRLDELLYTLREADADVVGLQELGSSSATAIQNELQDVYPYQVLYGYGTQGVGVLSHYPIVNHELVEGETSFPYLVATLDVEGHLLTVISAHPPSPMRSLTQGVYYSRGVEDVHRLAAQAGNGSPTLLLGDLNATPHSEEYALLKNAGLADSFQEAGWGFGNTFPAEPGRLMPGFPMVRIDYIWHTGDFRTTDVWVGSNGGSDHLPVYAQLIWQHPT
jgi:endonuclease/exonuclease/phosphatase (EEP) superfamily protein YafD